MRLTASILATLILTAPAHAQSAPAGPDLLRKALSPPGSSQMFAYDFEDIIEDKDGKRTVRGRVDPSRAKGDRVTIAFVEDLRKTPADMKATDQRYEKNADGDIFCDTASREDVTGIVEKGEAPDGGRIFGFVPKPEPQAEKMVKDLMGKMSAEAVVDEISGLLRSFKATLTRTHNVMVFGTVKQATYSAECKTLPNGRAYTVRTNLDALISAMGNSYRQKTVQLISNVTPVG
jgi:hypothetical protein